MLYKSGDYPTVTPQLLSMCAAGYPDAIRICSMAAAFAWMRERRRQHNSRPRSVESRKKWKIKNRDKMLAQARDYNMRPEVAEKRLASQKRLRAENPNKYKKMQAESFQRNKSTVYAYRNHRESECPQFKLGNRVRAYIGNSLKKRCGFKEESFWELVGCTTNELKAHIESQFQPGMTWANWTVNGWHIDHIRPLASFDLADKSQRIKAFHFSNMRPEWAGANRSKNSTHNGRRWTYKDHLRIEPSNGTMCKRMVSTPSASRDDPNVVLDVP